MKYWKGVFLVRFLSALLYILSLQPGKQEFRQTKDVQSPDIPLSGPFQAEYTLSDRDLGLSFTVMRECFK